MFHLEVRELLKPMSPTLADCEETMTREECEERNACS